ncbi:hypothetical protein BM221_004944 [Beauveria bassiana]|uniref:Uncharacterized protein n=1 Tax=Beauveria bassiana TaxID=176275 RepID=A0A2N6NM68_BEABA|nr:hypothetical protein BM221_004944 [Beauveria bassiana]
MANQNIIAVFYELRKSWCQLGKQHGSGLSKQESLLGSAALFAIVVYIIVFETSSILLAKQRVSSIERPMW